MHEIICPHCEKAFKIDEAGYADILRQQVHNAEFEQQLHDRLELAEKEKLKSIELVKEQASNEMQKAIASRNIEIQELKSKLNAGEVEQKLAVSEALKAVEKQRDKLASDLIKAKQDSEAASKLVNANHLNELQEISSRKDAEIHELNAKLIANEAKQKHAITEAVNVAEKKLDQIQIELERSRLEKQLAETSLRDTIWSSRFSFHNRQGVAGAVQSFSQPCPFECGGL